MGFQLIEDKLNEKVTKQQFLKECGLLLIGVLAFPPLINKLLIKNRFKLVGNQLFLDDEIIMEMSNG